ncbi:hypothetical protein [Streptomyces kronopolitis]|uniref:hypothetical protein n=1 Tax=Streptomyces kronopolitis TaxID=1612435 RepID=UPI00343BE42C
MAPETPPENAPHAHPESPRQLLERWTGELPYQLLLLEKVLLPEGFVTPGQAAVLHKELGLELR